MTFEQFAPARDFFYLAALLMGAGIGCILNRFRRTSGMGKNAARFKNRTVTAGLCFFSGLLAALTAAAVYSGWAIFTVYDLYIPLGLLAVVVALAFRFPRVVGFPLIIVSGVFMVWFGHACLRFSAIDSSDCGRVIREGDGSVLVRLSPNSINPAASVSIKLSGEDTVLEFQALRITVSKFFPLAGGVNRGAITGIWGNNEYLFGAPRQAQKKSTDLPVQPDMGTNERPSWVIFQEVTGSLEMKELPPGAGRTILFEGSTLAFR